MARLAILYALRFGIVRIVCFQVTEPCSTTTEVGAKLPKGLDRDHYGEPEIIAHCCTTARDNIQSPP